MFSQNKEETMDTVSKASGRAKLTLLLCFAIAIFEGFDLQSMGVAAPRMRAEFMLDNAQMAWAFSAAILGTLPGAILGGRFADIVGRKKILIWLILPPLMLIFLQGCAIRPSGNQKIKVSAETLYCVADDIDNNAMHQCTKDLLKRLEPFIE